MHTEWKRSAAYARTRRDTAGLHLDADGKLPETSREEAGQAAMPTVWRQPETADANFTVQKLASFAFRQPEEMFAPIKASASAKPKPAAQFIAKLCGRTPKSAIIPVLTNGNS